MTNTEPTSLESMLDAPEAVAHEIAPAAHPETGDNSAAPPADATQQADPSDNAPHVPRRALEDERRKRQELERRLQELTQPQQQYAPQQQPPQQQQGITAEQLDELWFTNPAHAAAIVTQIAQTNAVQVTERNSLSRELNRSEKRARKEHGDDVVSSAWEHAIRSGKGQAFIDEDDPYSSLVEWYQGERDKLRNEIIAEMGHAPNGQPAAPARTSAPVPKSLATRTSSAPRDPSTGQFASRLSLEELLN